MKCSVLSGKLAAEVVCNKAAGNDHKEACEVCSSVTVWEDERALVNRIWESGQYRLSVDFCKRAQSDR